MPSSHCFHYQHHCLEESCNKFKSFFSRRQLNFFDRLQVEFIITVPRRYDADLHTSGGSITVQNLEGILLTKTSGGSITVYLEKKHRIGCACTDKWRPDPYGFSGQALRHHQPPIFECRNQRRRTRTLPPFIRRRHPPQQKMTNMTVRKLPFLTPF
jgi:hypothetical protein